MLFADQRPHIGGLIIRHAQNQALRTFFHRCNKLVKQRTLDIHALGTQTHLTAVGKSRAHRAFDRRIKVTISEYDRGVFTAHLQAHRTRAFGRCLHDDLAGARFARECNRIHIGMRGDKFARRVRAKAMHHVVHACWNARFVHHFAEQRRRLRRFFGRLDHHGVAAGQCRRDFPRHQ